MAPATKWLELKYRCSCMDAETSCAMPARGDGETIEDFMTRLRIVLGNDHRSKSPNCRAEKVEHVKLPLADRGVVGGVDGGTA